MRQDGFGRRHVSLECPKCKFTMELLRTSPLLERDFRTSASGPQINRYGREVDTISISDLLYGLIGAYRNRKYRRIAEEYPNSLICPECEWIERIK